jgi:hypothetical protein
LAWWSSAETASSSSSAWIGCNRRRRVRNPREMPPLSPDVPPVSTHKLCA